MRTARLSLLAAVLLFLTLVLIAALFLFRDSGLEPTVRPQPVPPLAMAILGDSDSHSFHDREFYAPGSPERGGQFRATTFNWPEILQRLRGDQIDLGEWRVWGPRKPFAKARELLNLPVRRPRKEDYRYNFAINGAGCKDLNHGWRQVDRLLAVMDLEQQHWERGIVVIRIGINDIGGGTHLDEYAANPEAGADRINYCLGEIESAIGRIRAIQPKMRFVIVGIFNNANWTPNLEKWQSPVQLTNIARALERFDTGLKGLVANDPNSVYFDDDAWFKAHWGTRDDFGKPAYRAVVLPSGMRIENTQGDAPDNAVLGDGHAGTVWNGLWVESLVALLNENFDCRIRPIDVREVEALIQREH